jgi:hypothetical protein
MIHAVQKNNNQDILFHFTHYPAKISYRHDVNKYTQYLKVLVNGKPLVKPYFEFTIEMICLCLHGEHEKIPHKL